MPDDNAPGSTETLPEPPPVRRYSRQARFVRDAVKNRVPWRHRTRRKRQPQTQAEKEANAAERMKTRDNFRRLLNEARAQIWEIADNLQKETGCHSTLYFFQLLMQNSKKASKSRNVSLWNAYLHMRLKEINGGMC